MRDRVPRGVREPAEPGVLDLREGEASTSGPPIVGSTVGDDPLVQPIAGIGNEDDDVPTTGLFDFSIETRGWPGPNSGHLTVSPVPEPTSLTLIAVGYRGCRAGVRRARGGPRPCATPSR